MLFMELMVPLTIILYSVDVESLKLLYLVNFYIHDLPNCLSYPHPRSRANYENLTYTSHGISEIDQHMNID